MPGMTMARLPHHLGTPNDKMNGKTVLLNYTKLNLKLKDVKVPTTTVVWLTKWTS